MGEIFQFVQWMGNLPSSIALRESLWLYQFHVLTLTLFVGISVLWDLRDGLAPPFR